MKIGIIVHSQTGHTLLVGERICEKLQADGHEAQLERMQNLENEKAKNPIAVQLDSLPETGGYDALIFGAWYRALHYALDSKSMWNNFRISAKHRYPVS